MAKNKNNDDEFDLDSDNGSDDDFLDEDGEFNFDDMDSDLNSRETSLVGIGKEALKDAFMPEDHAEKAKIITDSIRRTLPNKLQTEANDFENLYSKVSDSVNKNLEGVGKDLKVLGGKIDKMLPKEGMFRDLFNKIYEREDAREAELSEEARKEQEIQAATAEALGDIGRLQEEASIRDNVLADKRTSSTNEILKLIAKDTNATRILGYEYSSKYYKKSLELQFRTASILKDTLEANKASYKEILTQLSSIAKNTSLPDLVKQRNMEMLTAGIKGKLRDYALDKMFGNDSLFDLIGQKIVGRINDIGTQTREYITSGDALADTVGGFFEDDGMMDPRSMVASMGAETARDFGADKVMGRLQKKFWGSKWGRKIAMGVKGLHDDPSSMLGEWAQNRKEKGGFFNKALSKIFGEASNLTRVGVKDRNANLRRLDLNTAATLDVRTKVSINQVIPGYLRKIHAETRAGRLGIRDEIIEKMELWYDYDREKFRSGSSITGGITSLIKGKTKSETKVGRERVKSLFTDEETLKAMGDDAFTKEELDAIANASVIGASKNNVGGIKFFESKEFLSALDPATRKSFEKKFAKYKDYIKDNDEDGFKYDNLRYGVSSLRSSLPAFEKMIENEFRNGNVEHLKAAGLVKYNRDTREYELDKKALAKLQLDQFGNHEHIEDVKDENLVNVRETVKGAVEATKNLKDKGTTLVGSAYDKFIPEDMKNDLTNMKNKITDKGTALFNKGKSSVMAGYDATSSFLAGRLADGVGNYFKNGKFKQDFNAFVSFIRNKLIPKFKSILTNFGELVIKHIPQWIKDKYNAIIEKIKGKKNDVGNKLMDRLEPDEQAYVLEAIAKVKKIKLSKLEKMAIDAVKNIKNKIQNFDANDAYNKMKGLFGKGKDKGLKLLNDAKDFGKGQIDDIKSMKDQGMSVKDIAKNKLKETGKLKDVAKEYYNTSKDYIKDKSKPFMDHVNKVSKIGYHLSLTKEQREKLEKWLDKYIVSNFKKVKSKIIELVPDGLKKTIADIKDGNKAIKVFNEWKNSLGPEERDKVVKEVIEFAKANGGKYTGNIFKATGNLLGDFKDQYLGKTVSNENNGTSAVSEIDKSLTESIEATRNKVDLENITVNSKDRADAINALKNAAKTLDRITVDDTYNELTSAKPGLAKDKNVTRTYNECLSLCGKAEKAGQELMDEMDKTKDEDAKSGMFGNIMGKAWGFVPMGGMLKMGFKGAGIFGKGLWTVEKFLWKNVYKKLFMAPFKASWWLMKKTIIGPLGKLGSFIGEKTGLNKFFGKFKNFFKGGFLKNIGKAAAGLAGGIGGIFGLGKKKKKVVNGVEVEEGGLKKKEKGGGLFGLLKSLGSKLLFVLGPIFGLFTKMFKGGGKGLLGFGKTIGKGLFKMLRGTLPKLLGTIFGGVGGFLKDSLFGAFNSIKSGLSSAFKGITSSISSALGTAKEVVENVVDNVKDKAKGAWETLKGWGGKAVDTVKSGYNKVKAGVGKVIDWAAEGLSKAKQFCKELTKAMYDKIVKGIEKFKGMCKGPLVKKFKGQGLKIFGKLVAKIGARLVPNPVGLGLLAIDVGTIGSMLLKNVKLLSAISICYIGIDIFSDSDSSTENVSSDLLGEGGSDGTQPLLPDSHQKASKEIRENNPQAIPKDEIKKRNELAITEAANKLGVDPKQAKELANKISGMSLDYKRGKGIGLYGTSVDEMKSIFEENKDRFGISNFNPNDPYQQTLYGLTRKSKFEYINNEKQSLDKIATAMVNDNNITASNKPAQPKNITNVTVNTNQDELIKQNASHYESVNKSSALMIEQQKQSTASIESLNQTLLKQNEIMLKLLDNKQNNNNTSIEVSYAPSNPYSVKG